ncbi:MAG TPA: ATP-binding protein [Polyangiaceae bacterium]|nr:ATP-binding protein [Polyangiaceae bacterium]
MLMWSWLKLPSLPDEEDARRQRLLSRMLAAMVGLAFLGCGSSLLEPHNSAKITLLFYGIVLVCLLGVGVFLWRGRVIAAGWVLSIFFWLLIAFVTVLFGGMQGQNAASFTVCVLLLGSTVSGRAAVVMALVTSAWCVLIATLEKRGLLPTPLEPYSPINAWAAVTITVLLTAVLLRSSLESLQRMHARAEQSARERDEALRRSIHGQKMELVGNLTSGIAHDFNNLLTVICNVSELLRAEGEAQRPSVANLLDDLDEATSRATLMTGQLLSLGRAPVTGTERVDVSLAVKSLARTLPRLLGSNVRLEVHAPDPAIVSASPAGLQQIVLNLAVNAKDALPDGGRIAISVRVHESRVSLVAEDNGVGMTEATRARIFEPFFTTKSHGTGLGLATVRELVKRYGAEIEVTSTLGKGTRFEVRFPRLVPVTLSERAPRPSDRAPAPSRQRRLLLVEDDQLVRRSLTRWLISEGFEVIAVAHGEEALSVLKAAGDIACVVSDIAMSGLDGERLADMIAEQQPDLPVVLVSGNRTPSSNFTASPRRAFVPKPVSQESLVNALARMIAEPAPGAIAKEATTEAR